MHIGMYIGMYIGMHAHAVYLSTNLEWEWFMFSVCTLLLIISVAISRQFTALEHTETIC